ncbi:MAG TPA: hypothetical protein VFR08_14265 [Candidatus Angelobacter sp.]|nr:hypothetical protein [Candidatus Angelobacter sp.]
MSDFLGRLAARTLGAAPLVQPMGRNMFAPGVEQPGQEGFIENVSNSERSANYSQGHTDSSVISPARERPPVTANPSDLPQTTFSIVDLRAAFHPDLNTASPRVPTVDHSGGTQADLKFKRDTVEGAAAAQVIQTTQQKSQDDFVSPANGLLVPAANLQREAFPASLSFPEDFANRERSVDASSSAPVVKVSIGRVEIRAEFPAAVAKTSPQHSPSLGLSLDEYARLRREGKR